MRVYRRNILWQKAVPALLAALVLLPVLAFGKGGRTKQTEWKSEASSRKADYVFMEAMRQNTIGNDDAYFELLAAAHRLHPTWGAIFIWAICSWRLGSRTPPCRPRAMP